ncbi:MAG: SusC/RagA family TonB-linked outer membrane protein [Bacteroidia bacterium]|nr:SusC/RagA family TonB-linked outer membrane protein [Bacteroidia bacterium]
MRRIVSLLVACFVTVAVWAQSTVTGTVTDAESGSPIEGAAVLVKGTTAGVFTDGNGRYSVSVPAGAQTLVFTYVGKARQEVAIGSRAVVDVLMQPEDISMDEVVVTALGVAKSEKAIGFAVQEVEGGEIRKAGETNFVSALSGKVAGLQVTSSTGTAGASAYFQIRGANSINRDNQPLIIVDGMPINNQQLRSGDAVASVAYSNRAIDINQADIESITVLKGAAATAIYGSQAGNGAILITTKKGKGSKFAVDYSGSVTRSEANKFLELQDQYSQGTGSRFSGPHTGNAGSWGAKLDTLFYVKPGYTYAASQDRNGDGVYDWDKNGLLVGKSSPDADLSNPAKQYDRYKFFQPAISTSHNVAISASSQTSSVRFSLGFLDETGIVPNNSFQRINASVNAETKLWEDFTVGANVQYVNSGGTRIEQGSNVSGVMLGLVRTPVTFDNSNGFDDPSTEAGYLFPDGLQRAYRGLTGTAPNGGRLPVYDNPYWTAYNNPLNDDVNRVIGSVSLKYTPTDWLSISYRPGVDVYSDVRKQYFALYSATAPGGSVIHDIYNVRKFNADLIVNARRELTDFLTASLTLGHNMRQDELGNVYTRGNNLTIPGFYNLSNTASVISTEFYSLGRNQAFFGGLDLELLDYFFVNGTFRREQELSLDGRGFNYYSVGGSFIFSDLPALKSITNFLNYGKLRASYGLVGLGTAAYSTNTVFVAGGGGDGWTDGISFPFNGLSAFSFSDRLGNPDLQPEIRGSFEVGIDIRILQNRVGLDVAYYSSRSENVILAVPVTGSSGFQTTVQNAAVLTNKGIEAVLTLNPVKTTDFNWDINVNFTRNRNNVEELAEGVTEVFLGGFTGASTRAVVGYPYGTIFGFGFYRDANGERVIGDDGFPVLDPNEKAFASALPDYQVGIRNTLSFKGISLSGLIDIKQGGYLWNGTRSALYFFGTAKEAGDLRGTQTVFDGNVATYDSEGNIVLADHDNNPATPDLPVTSGANATEVTLGESWLRLGNANGFFGDNTEDFVEEASWFRVRDISLSYALPKSILGSRIKGLSVTLSGRNVFLSTPYKGIDPETNLYGASNAQGLDYFNMPNTKSYTAALNLSF